MDVPFTSDINPADLIPKFYRIEVKPSTINNGPYKNETLEKFITLCRSRLIDTPNRRKKRYSGLRRAVGRYNLSRHWNEITFENLINRFSCIIASEIDHKQADKVYGDFIKELSLLTGRGCSGRCRRKKKKSKNESTLVKLEKSLALLQRRINRMKDESSTNTWEARDGKNNKLQDMQKKAFRLTKKINDMNKLVSGNSNANLASNKSLNETNDAVDDNDVDLDELNALLKSVRLKERMKKRNRDRLSDNNKAIRYLDDKAKYEMVEIKKYDQVNRCYVSPADKNSSNPMPFKFTVRRIDNTVPKPIPSPSSSFSNKCSTILDLDNSVNSNTKSPTKQSLDKRALQMIRLRKESTFDLICDRFRHVTLNS